MEEPVKRVRKSTEADRIRAAKWIAAHSERYYIYQREYAEKNRDIRNKRAREKYAREHPNFKRITKYRKREDGKVELKEKPEVIAPPKPKKKKVPKPVETFTSNPAIICHVKWLMELKKSKNNETL